jgi:hypothetical protein
VYACARFESVYMYERGLGVGMAIYGQSHGVLVRT